MSTKVTAHVSRGVPVVEGSRLRTWPQGRRCASEGCETLLSVYNPARYCSVHVTAIGLKKRRPERPLRLVACAHCGTEFETTNPVRLYCSDRCRMAAFAVRQRGATRVNDPK